MGPGGPKSQGKEQPARTRDKGVQERWGGRKTLGHQKSYDI